MSSKLESLDLSLVSCDLHTQKFIRAWEWRRDWLLSNFLASRGIFLENQLALK
jgi:hypothetical protein